MSRRPWTVGDLLAAAAERFPGKTAVIHGRETASYASLLDDALRLKGLLRELGVRKGDRVGIYLDKSIAQLTAMFATSMAGGVFVFINPLLKRGQIEYIVNDCQIEVLVATRELAQRAQLAAPRAMVCFDDAAEPAPGEHSWPSLRSELPPDRSPVPVISDDIACLIYTSGSTGMPKGVVVPHRTVVEGAEIVSSYLDITERERIISVLPLNFDYGLNQATSAVLNGATLVLHQFVMVRDLLDVLIAEKITGFAGMPPIWGKMFSDKFRAASRLEFPHLRYITNSGGKVPRVMVDRIRAFFPGSRLFLMYGLTEAFRSTYLPPEELERRPNSIGKAIPNVEIMVVDDKGDEVAVDQEGELVHRGSLVTLGYWNDRERTNKVFRRNPRQGSQPHFEETVVYSGDIVKRDADGFLYFVSRRDEMIKTSGFRVSPTEVEEVLAGLAGVSGVVVFGTETETGDQAIVAVLETDRGDEDKDAVLRECRRLLPGYMVPQHLWLLPEFPRTANGKIDRTKIKGAWLGARDAS